MCLRRRAMSSGRCRFFFIIFFFRCRSVVVLWFLFLGFAKSDLFVVLLSRVF